MEKFQIYYIEKNGKLTSAGSFGLILANSKEEAITKAADGAFRKMNIEIRKVGAKSIFDKICDEFKKYGITVNLEKSRSTVSNYYYFSKENQSVVVRFSDHENQSFFNINDADFNFLVTKEKDKFQKIISIKNEIIDILNA